jgi:trans-aconitate methyltransferase
MVKTNLFQFIAKIIRQNRNLEIAAYITQNLLRLNTQGEGSFGRTSHDVFDYYRSTLDLYVDQVGENSFRNKTILELGPGLSVVGMLEAIRRYDVKKVYSYDRYNRLSKSDEIFIRENNLEEYRSRLVYFFGPPAKILEVIPCGEVDTILSNAVLEFVPDLRELFDMIWHCAAPNSVSFHRVDLKCHNKFKAKGELYFHTFSDFLWKSMGDNIGQLNRVSVSQYFDIFASCGFQIKDINLKEFSHKVLDDASYYLGAGEVDDNKYSDADFILGKVVERDNYNYK